MPSVQKPEAVPSTHRAQFHHHQPIPAATSLQANNEFATAFIANRLCQLQQQQQLLQQQQQQQQLRNPLEFLLSAALAERQRNDVLMSDTLGHLSTLHTSEAHAVPPPTHTTVVVPPPAVTSPQPIPQGTRTLLPVSSTQGSIDRLTRRERASTFPVQSLLQLLADEYPSL